MVVDQSVLHFFTDASTIVKGVMLVLLGASLVSWTIIFQRSSFYRRLSKLARQFEETFWSGLDLTQLYGRVSQKKVPHLGLAAIFQAGFESFSRKILPWKMPNAPWPLRKIAKLTKLNNICLF
jgi:biopolymer transport protein TolQ